MFCLKKDGNRPGFVVEAFLSYWLSWYLLLGGLGDGLNMFVFFVGYFDHEGGSLH